MSMQKRHQEENPQRENSVLAAKFYGPAKFRGEIQSFNEVDLAKYNQQFDQQPWKDFLHGKQQ